MANLPVDPLIDAFMQATTKAGMRGAMDLDGRTTSNTNFVFEGDSLTTPSAGTDWPAKLMLLSEFASKGTSYNEAASGQNLADITSQYATEIHPLRPTGPITSALLFVWIGANDLVGIPDVEAWKTAWDAYIDGAIADGFTIVAFTLIKRTGTGTTAYTEPARLEWNTHIRHSTKWDYLIDTARLFPDQSESYFWADDVHVNEAAKAALAWYINNVFAAGGALNQPSSSYPAVGTGEDEVPTNGALKGSARSYTAAQVQAQTELTDAATILWDTELNPNALVVLGGDRMLGTPTNPVAGGLYRLLVVQDDTGSRLLTYGDTVKWPGDTAPTLSTDPNNADLLEFYFNGDYMLGRAVAQDYDVFVDPALLVQEQFSGTGSDSTLNGTPPDVVNTPGNNWAVVSGTGIRKNSNSTGEITGLTTIDVGQEDKDVRAHIISGFGGIAVRAVDEDNCLLLVMQVGGSGWALYNRASGSYNLVASGAENSECDLRFTSDGVTVTAYIDNVEVATVDTAAHQSSTKAGMFSVSGTAVLDDFEVYQI